MEWEGRRRRKRRLIIIKVANYVKGVTDFDVDKAVKFML